MFKIFTIILIINSCVFLAHSVQANTIEKALASPFECEVISAYGTFGIHNREPVSGIKTIIDFKILRNQIGTIDFTDFRSPATDNEEIYTSMPYLSPFKISKQYFYENGEPSSIQLVSSHSQSSRVIIEALLGGKRNALVNIRNESSARTIGIAFMNCIQNSGITNQPSGR